MWSLLALMLAASPPVGEPRLPPKDECAADASFRRFRADLLSAIARRDERHLLSVVADGVMVDFGPEGSGRAAFHEAWGLAEASQSQIWGELAEVFRLGCTLAGDTASAPSLLDQLPADRDPFMSLLAVRPAARLYAGPSVDAPVIATLDWHLLRMAEQGGADGWAPIRLTDGRTGYVRWEDVRSPIDYRAVFQKQDGRWMITALVAGD